MNKDIAEGKWEQFKANVKKTWAKITDDDIALMKAKKQEFAGILQERYGYEKEEAQTQIDKFIEEGGYYDNSISSDPMNDNLVNRDTNDDVAIDSDRPSKNVA
jgi:uncharacterized protein YjbJ (UPF0337 family)